MKKILTVAALCLLACGATALAQVAPGAPLPLGAVLRNNSSAPMAVIGFCNATSAPKDLEGYVGHTSGGLSLIASESGTARESITIIVPAHWYYEVRVNSMPAGVSCLVTGWPV